MYYFIMYIAIFNNVILYVYFYLDVKNVIINSDLVEISLDYKSIISHIFLGKGIYNCRLDGNYCFNITSNVRLLEVKSRLILISFI